MTPQLQQAIRLLQLSTLDLQQEIQQALDSNPLLELSEDDSTADTSTDEQDTPSASDGPLESLEQLAASAGESATVSGSDSADVMPGRPPGRHAVGRSPPLGLGPATL